MKDLLFLSHRIPHPPDKGDKIRSHHLLAWLSRQYRVHLGAFLDDPRDEGHVPAASRMVEGESLLLPLTPMQGKLRAAASLIKGEAITPRYYQDARMAQWVRGVHERHAITRILVYSSAMAPYGLLGNRKGTRRILDLVDVDSAKWRRYGEVEQSWRQWIYQREGRLLLGFERDMAQRFDAAFFVSPGEADLFRELAPETAERVDYWENGVDFQRFSPERLYANPYPGQSDFMVFTGAMDYWPNVDAVCWFAETVLPKVVARHPQVRLAVVGKYPHPRIQKLGRLPEVLVTGRVEDVRPYLAHARLAIAPMRLGQGVQNKVLEAMAMALPVLVTPKALAGIRPCPELAQWVSDDADSWVELAVALLTGKEERQVAGQIARQWILAHYRWEENLKRLLPALEGGEGPKK